MTKPQIACPSMAEILKSVWPQGTAKHAAVATSRSHRTIQDWLQKRCTPSADTLLKMAAENQELRAELIRRLEAFGYDPLLEASAGADLAPMRREDGDAGGSDRPAGAPDALGTR